MNEGLLPSRYAKALFKFAAEKSVEGEIYEAMRNISHLLESKDGNDFRSAISNPFIDDLKKRSLILAAAGIKDSKSASGAVFNDFLTLLFKNNRIGELRGIVYAYDTLYRKEKNISRVHVTWAASPGKQSEDRLQKMISARLGNGTMEYTSSVNPDLIGGFKIAIDNELLDASVENELRQLRQQILSK